MSLTTFVVGQWVRAEKFYGRTALIEEILNGPRNWLWLLGTRRIGKTSLLKQIEHLTASSRERGYFPLFWDFQGADSPGELHMSFRDSLLDAEERLDEHGIELAQVEDEDLFRSMGLLRRKLRSKKLKLLLLCDEVEELIKLNQQDAGLLRKLRRGMQAQEDIRSVLASTIRLWALAGERGDTSPFLHGFTPPLYIHNLTDEEARSLIGQANLPGDSRPRFDERTAEIIRTHCDNHPYLIQLLAKRFLELENPEEAIEHVAVDPMVSFFFAVDFEMLSKEEQTIIRVIAEHDSSTSNSIQQHLPLDDSHLGSSLQRLEHLGYIRKNQERRFVLVNFFFRRWFRQQPGPSPAADGGTPTAAVRTNDSTLSSDGELGLLDGRYELQQSVGKGAMGLVYKAYDRMLRSTIALKLLRPEYAANEEVLERLRREIVLSRDIAHPNILRIYHLGESQGKKFLTMQWMDGPTLAWVIGREAPLRPARLSAIAGKLAAALEAAHACRVLHRDIKPSNIMMGDGDEPYIGDFGLARLMGDPGLTSAGIFIGTPDYASPEQARTLPLDERSDLYSFGVVLFEMATGRRPFIAGSTREVLQLHRSAAPPDPRSLCPSVHAGLAALILRCLAKDPARRFQSATELRAALGRLAHS